MESKKESRNLSRTTKFVWSFISCLSGWITGFLFYAAYMTFLTTWRRPTDVEAILFWSGIFIGVAWLLVVLPFVLSLGESSSLLRLPRAVLLGTISGLVIFLVLAGWWTGFWTDGLYLGYAMVVGAFTGGTYAVLLRIRQTKAEAKT